MCSMPRYYIRAVTCALALCLSAIITNSSYAQSAGASLQTLTSGASSLFVDVKKISDNVAQTDDKVYWSVSAFDGGWVIADQYLEVSYSDVPEFWGIQIYTDNKAETADPKYTGARNPAGLVDINRTASVLPMAWLVTDHILSSNERADTFKPLERPRTSAANFTEGFTNYMWHFLVDKNTQDDPTTAINEAFADAKDYIVLWNQLGIAWNEGGKAKRPQKAYVYLAAKFATAYAGASYKTSTLTFELYHGINPFPLYIYKDAPKTLYPNLERATLENHYIPGYMNYFIYEPPRGPNIIVDDKYATNPHSGSHCLKVTWTGRAGYDSGNWAGIMWLEPEQGWQGGPDKGYDLRGVTRLSFWARSDNPGAELSVFFGLNPDSSRTPPYLGDSCRRTPPDEIWKGLTTEWDYYEIPVLLSRTEDMSYVVAGFGIVFNDVHDGQSGSPGYTVYLDDIKFETGL
jgi:hypothetical protein